MRPTTALDIWNLPLTITKLRYSVSKICRYAYIFAFQFFLIFCPIKKYVSQLTVPRLWFYFLLDSLASPALVMLRNFVKRIFSLYVYTIKWLKIHINPITIYELFLNIICINVICIIQLLRKNLRATPSPFVAIWIRMRRITLIPA